MKGYRPGTALGISQALSERQHLRMVRLVPEGSRLKGARRAVPPRTSTSSCTLCRAP